MYISSKWILVYITISSRLFLNKTAQAHPEPCQRSKMERFSKIVEVFQSLIIVAKRSILDVWRGSEYVSELHYEVHNTAQKGHNEVHYFFVFFKQAKNKAYILSRVFALLAEKFYLPVKHKSLSKKCSVNIVHFLLHFLLHLTHFEVFTSSGSLYCIPA